MLLLISADLPSLKLSQELKLGCSLVLSGDEYFGINGQMLRRRFSPESYGLCALLCYQSILSDVSEGKAMGNTKGRERVADGDGAMLQVVTDCLMKGRETAGQCEHVGENRVKL